MKHKIGIFDSGIGGFTILGSLLQTRKDVEVFYLADTKRVPYGNKDFEQIRSIAKEICYWFENKNLDVLFIQYLLLVKDKDINQIDNLISLSLA